MKKSRTLYIAIPIAIVLLIMTLYEYGYRPLTLEIEEKAQMRELKTETLNRYSRIIAEIPALEEELNQLIEKKKSFSQYLFEGQTQSVAASTLQDTVKNIITSRGGTTQSQRTEKPTKLGSYNVVSINFGATVPDIRTLTDILIALQNNKPSIVIKELDIRVQNFRDPRQLMVHITVNGITEAK